MCIDELLTAADFSKETNFKERLYNKLNMILSDGELDDDEAATVVAARGVIGLPVHYRKKKTTDTAFPSISHEENFS